MQFILPVSGGMSRLQPRNDMLGLQPGGILDGVLHIGGCLVLMVLKELPLCHGLFGPELGGLQRCLVGLPRAAGAPECGEVLPEAGLACLVLQYLRRTCFLPALSSKQTGVGIPLQYGNGVREAVFQCLQRREQHRKLVAL